MFNEEKRPTTKESRNTKKRERVEQYKNKEPPQLSKG